MYKVLAKLNNICLHLACEPLVPAPGGIVKVVWTWNSESGGATGRGRALIRGMAFQAHTERTAVELTHWRCCGSLQKSEEMEEDDVGTGGEMEEDRMRISNGMWG